ncbi:glycosyltransferase [Massilia niastensis]|uniref:glycosyltransferase n=1 Tax=Massilia niastensis TaxID=544911 RepID=UPI0003712798|nr:glycosyltransferase [Massilia niastensis]
MAHFAVVGPAFPSHYSALAALAAELADHGHRISFLHRPDAGAFLDDPRMGFHAIGHDSHPPGTLAGAMRRAANPGGPLGLRRVIADMASGTDMLCRELPGAFHRLGVDAVIADQMEAAGGLVAEALGLPFVSVANSLPVNREPGIPLPVMPFAHGEDARALRIVEGSTRVYDWMMAPHRRVIEAHARRFGLGRRGMLHECLSPLAQVSQTVAEFEFPRRALPPHFYHVGPLRRMAAPGARDQAMPQVDPGRPFVFASLGTMQGHRYGLFKRIALACRRLDVQLLLAHCGGLDARHARALERLGATWVCAFAPQLAALERADAVVSHAGSNTVMDAIAACTPMLALPIAFDQPGAAARIAHRGIGLCASARFATAAQLAGKLRRLLDEPEFARRMAPMAESIRQAGGAPRAAAIIEAALRLERPAGSVACLG